MRHSTLPLFLVLFLIGSSQVSIAEDSGREYLNCGILGGLFTYDPKSKCFYPGDIKEEGGSTAGADFEAEADRLGKLSGALEGGTNFEIIRQEYPPEKLSRAFMLHTACMARHTCSLSLSSYEDLLNFIGFEYQESSVGSGAPLQSPTVGERYLTEDEYLPLKKETLPHYGKPGVNRIFGGVPVPHPISVDGNHYTRWILLHPQEGKSAEVKYRVPDHMEQFETTVGLWGDNAACKESGSVAVEIFIDDKLELNQPNMSHSSRAVDVSFKVEPGQILLLRTTDVGDRFHCEEVIFANPRYLYSQY